jgi:hypothetical protein
MGSVRGLRGEGELLAGSEAAVGCETLLACADTKRRRTRTHQSCQCDQHQSRRQSHS